MRDEGTRRFHAFMRRVRDGEFVTMTIMSTRNTNIEEVEALLPEDCQDYATGGGRVLTAYIPKDRVQAVRTELEASPLVQHVDLPKTMTIVPETST